MNLKPKLQHIPITCSPTAELATYGFPAQICAVSAKNRTQGAHREPKGSCGANKDSLISAATDQWDREGCMEDAWKGFTFTLGMNLPLGQTYWGWSDFENEIVG